ASVPHRARGPGGALGQPVPLHGLREDPRRRLPGGRAPKGLVPWSAVWIDGCEVVATMDDAGTEIPGGSILVEDGAIAWGGSGRPPGAEDADRIDGRGTVAVPGLVNTHHHLYQTMTRARARERGLFD